MNNLMLQLTKTAAKRSPDTGAAHTSMHEGAAMDNGQMPAGDLAQEVWRREEELKRREAEIIRRELHAKAVEALTALETEAADLNEKKKHRLAEKAPVRKSIVNDKPRNAR